MISTEEGNFTYPRGVYNDHGIFYVGDYYSVQLFHRNGVFIQRIGEKREGTSMNHFEKVYSLCILENYLHVCDYGNDRVQIFRRP